MSTQSTHQRPGLVPKMTVDVNGNPKKVWVRPEEMDGPRPDATLSDLKPIIKKRLAEGLTHLRTGERQGSLRHTAEEKETASERGYGSDSLRDAAARKFERDFGVSMKAAPAVELGDDQLYDYLSRGLSVEQAHEFARFGIEPHLTHPKLDAEYAFIAGPKVLKADLKNQEATDSSLRASELKDIKQTARSLENLGVDPYVAAQCLSNGLRMEHLKDRSRDINETVEMSAKNNVESEAFRSYQGKPGTIGGAKEKLKEWNGRARRAMWRGTKRWARRRARRIYNRIQRRISRILKVTFLPWKTR